MNDLIYLLQLNYLNCDLMISHINHLVVSRAIIAKDLIVESRREISNIFITDQLNGD